MQFDTLKLNPIKNELLANSTDIIKNTYLKMLAVVLRQGNEVNEKQDTIFREIVAGAYVEYEAIDYLRMAKQLNESDISKFEELCSNTVLKYRFVLDSFVLSSLCGDSQEQCELIVEICDTVNIDKNEIGFLSLMAKAIVTMELTLYANAVYQKPTNIIDKVYYGYYLILQSYFKEIKGIEIIQGFDFIERPISVVTADARSIGGLAYINMDLTSIVRNESLCFYNKTYLLISGCVFMGSEYPIKIENCKDVKIINSKFMYFKKRALQIETINNVLVDNSEFTSCFIEFVLRGRSTVSSPKTFAGGVVYSEKKDIGVMVMNNCHFDSCGTKNQKGAIAAPCITNIDCEVRNSTFKNCFCENNNRSFIGS